MKAEVHSIKHIKLIAETDADFALLKEWSEPTKIVRLASSIYTEGKVPEMIIEFVDKTE